MMGKIAVLAALLGAAYWYWSGPYRDRVDPSYDTILEVNARNMSECLRAEAFKHGATGGGLGAKAAREKCAETFNVYEEDGQ